MRGGWWNPVGSRSGGDEPPRLLPRDRAPRSPHDTFNRAPQAARGSDPALRGPGRLHPRPRPVTRGPAPEAPASKMAAAVSFRLSG